MKKLLELLIVVKNFAAMAFAGIIMLFVVAGYFFGLSSIGFSYVWQAVFIALISGILYFVAFSDHVIKNKSYPVRLMLFAVPLYLAAGAFAVFFKWFPAGLGYWAIFTLAFAVGFGALAGAYYVYSKITGVKYNQMLAVYLSKQVK
jgi:hypothetical protein